MKTRAASWVTENGSAMKVLTSIKVSKNPTMLRGICAKCGKFKPTCATHGLGDWSSVELGATFAPTTTHIEATNFAKWRLANVLQSCMLHKNISKRIKKHKRPAWFLTRDPLHGPNSCFKGVHMVHHLHGKCAQQSAPLPFWATLRKENWHG